MSANSEVGTMLITGERRSGTTLVANFLNAQPRAVVYADLLRSLFAQARSLRIQDPNRPLTSRERNVLLSNLVAEGLEASFDGFADLRRENCPTWMSTYRGALESLRGGRSVDLVGTKVTAEYDLLRGLLGAGVRVIFCVRDPRDVLLSAKNRFGTYNMFDFVSSWRRSVAVAASLASERNFRMVRFEDFVGEERAQACESLAQFLGMPIDPDAGLVHRSGVSFRDNSSFGDVQRPFDSQARYRWKSTAPDADEIVFPSAYLKAELEALGYDPLAVAPYQSAPLYAAYARYTAGRSLLDGVRRLFHAATGT